MNMEKVTSDVSSFFNRTLQKTEEAFKMTEKTTPDPQVEHLTAECNKRKKWADNLISLLQSVIQPSMAARLGEMVLKNLDAKKERLNDIQQLGEEMVRIGTELGNDPHGSSLVRCGEAEQSIGRAATDLQKRVEEGYLEALREYSQSCSKAALKEREKLEDLRLDLDRAKTVLKRSRDDASKKQQCEQQVTEAQTAYNRQLDVTKRHLEKCISDFGKLRDSLTGFLNVQREYHEGCLRALGEALQ